MSFGHCWACLKADKWPQILAVLFFFKSMCTHGIPLPVQCTNPGLLYYKNLQSLSYDQFHPEKHMSEQLPWELELKTGTQIC